MVASTTVEITINGAPHEVEPGRTCVVEVEGMRGQVLACSTQVREGMVVRTDSPATLEMRQEVMAFILANHSDRCLTCHRVEHCRTGDICLRDNVVTHRCVTC